jgi:hypothetical protein
VASSGIFHLHGPPPELEPPWPPSPSRREHLRARAPSPPPLARTFCTSPPPLLLRGCWGGNGRARPASVRASRPTEPRREAAMEDGRVSATSATPPRPPHPPRFASTCSAGSSPASMGPRWAGPVRAERPRWAAPVRAESPEQGQGRPGDPAPPRVDPEQGRERMNGRGGAAGGVGMRVGPTRWLLGRRRDLKEDECTRIEYE